MSNDESYRMVNKSPEDHSVASRKQERDQLKADIEAFLAGGGKIEAVDPNVTADPPKKPSNNYTSRSI